MDINLSQYTNSQTGSVGWSQDQIEEFIRKRNPFLSDQQVANEVKKYTSRESKIEFNRQLFTFRP